MKRTILILGVIGALAWLGSLRLVHAQPKSSARYEYAIVRWEEPDRLYYNMPNNQFELVSFYKTGKNIPKDASNEEFCLTEACNFMARSGWEPVNLDSQRIVFRRPAN